MNEQSRVNFALCWHMHQPWYQHGIDGDYCLPWVYLHAIKDYSDMVTHLEAHPAMKATVNFAPVLLEQLDDYANQLRQWLQHGSRMRDPLLNLLAGDSHNAHRFMPVDGLADVAEYTSRVILTLLDPPHKPA